jgi:hypothetical protein
VQIAKPVGALPATLEPDTLYALRTGAGFALFMTDATGATAHSLNQSSGGGAQEVFVQQTRPAGLGPWMWWRKDTNGAIFDLVITDGLA